MSSTINISLSDRALAYSIFIDSSVQNTLSELSKQETTAKFFFICDRNVFFHWEKKLSPIFTHNNNLIIEPGEDSKSFINVEQICTFLNENGCDRSSIVVAIGGGVICDLVGFAASIYLRGIRCVYFPTTLLSQVDASVGGKTGINFHGLKNIVGTFSNPLSVYIGTDFLSTLPERDLNSGFAEIIKHALIADYQLYQSLQETNQKDLDLEQIVARSIQIKANIVESDWVETGERKILNFGHTLGHALESYFINSNDRLLHGEAVSLGVVAATYISCIKGLINSRELEDIEKLLNKFQLPTRLTHTLEFEEIVMLLSKDKKSSAGDINWTLLESIGKGIINQAVSNKECQKAFDYFSTTD